MRDYLFARGRILSSSEKYKFTSLFSLLSNMVFSAIFSRSVQSWSVDLDSAVIRKDSYSVWGKLA